MNSQEAIAYIEKIKAYVMSKGYPFQYSEFCSCHELTHIIQNKHVIYKLYPVLQTKDTNDVILYMNQYGRQINKNGNQGNPIYEYFGMLSFDP